MCGHIRDKDITMLLLFAQLLTLRANNRKTLALVTICSDLYTTFSSVCEEKESIYYVKSLVAYQ